jgi:electron transport complex protein RnfC
MSRLARKLWHFHGGLHLPAHKAESTRLPIQPLSIPARLVIPLSQHIGNAAEPVVGIGEHVLKGQLIARACGYISVPIHAGSSGTVVAIDAQPIPHPSGLSAPCIVIDTDGKDTWQDRPPPTENYTQLDPSALRNLIREAGIVGLGGAGFPSYIKLNPGPNKTIDTLILNGAECEPYITCDDLLMRERAREIIEGAKIMRHALQAKHCVIGIEDNKAAAIDALTDALAAHETEHIDIVRVPTRYPAGGERQLIMVLAGKEVPSQGLPLDIGVVCHNVATAAAVFRAVHQGEPLISRVITVTGEGVAKPCNIEVLIGTSFAEVLARCGGYTEHAERLVMGGPMMGFALANDAVPVIKTTNCILVQRAPEVTQPEMPCIRCGECVRACPANLLPQQLYWYAHARDFDKIQDYHLFDCIECGCCAHVCPSHIPLVHYYRFAKTEIWAQEKDKEKADIARRRHEFRLERIEREKTERAEKLARKKAALDTGMAGAPDPKKAAIDAALARVRDKQDEYARQRRNVDNLTDEQRRQIAEVEARRKQRNRTAGGADHAE